MRKKLIWALAIFFVASFVYADWYYNPQTGTIDYYEPTGVIITGSYLTLGLNATLTQERVLTAGTGITFTDTGAGGTLTVTTDDTAIDHDALSNFVAAEHLLITAIDHDGLLNYVAGQHIVLPNTIATVLTDHDLAAHTALGLAIIAHAMATHSDEDTYTISTTGDLTADDGILDKLEVNESFTYDAVQTATGDGTTTIDWGLGNVFYFTFGAQNDTFTFTAPPGVAKLTLVLKQDGVGSRIPTWPGTVLWPGNVAPTLSAGIADVDIVAFLWDGTNYFGLFNGNFE